MSTNQNQELNSAVVESVALTCTSHCKPSRCLPADREDYLRRRYRRWYRRQQQQRRFVVFMISHSLIYLHTAMKKQRGCAEWLHLVFTADLLFHVLMVFSVCGVEKEMHWFRSCLESSMESWRVLCFSASKPEDLMVKIKPVQRFLNIFDCVTVDFNTYLQKIEWGLKV